MALVVERLQHGDASVQRSVRGILDRIDAIEARSIVPGVLIRDLALSAGDNSILHRLGRRPRMWVPSRIRGAFASASAGGGSVLYKDITPPRIHIEDNTNGGGSPDLAITMGFTPADGSTLIALIVCEDSSKSISSIAQTGVTWANVSGPVGSAVNHAAEMWIGHTIASAGTGITITFNANILSVTQVGVVIAEIPEITGTAGIDAASAESQDRIVDLSTILSGSPVPNSAGDIVVVGITHNLTTSNRPIVGHGWRCIGAHQFSGDQETLALYAKVAQETEEQAFRGYTADLADRTYQSAAFATNLAAVGGGGSVTIPHGLREVSADNTALVLNSISDVTIDLWVA